MSKVTVLALMTAIALALAATLAFYAIAPGRWVSFIVWKSLSGKAHGGWYADINNVSIYYETYGAGSPVIVLHGGLGSLNSMSYQIMALASSHFVVAADSRGHGRSTDSELPLSYSLMSDDMLKLLDHLEIDRADIVGWSDGAIIGLEIAIRHPERVRRLVAISANYDVGGLIGGPSSGGETPVTNIPPSPFGYRLLAPDPGHWPVLYGKVMTMQRSQPRYTLHDLNRIKAPTLVMAGEFDIVKREHTDRLAEAISASQEVIIDGATHLVPFDKPEIVNSYTLKFLDERVRH